MNNPFKTAGLLLICLAGLLALWSADGMISMFNSATRQGASPPMVAEGLEAALTPMMIGGPVFFVGLLLWIVGWWRGRARSIANRLRRMA